MDAIDTTGKPLPRAPNAFGSTDVSPYTESYALSDPQTRQAIRQRVRDGLMRDEQFIGDSIKAIQGYNAEQQKLSGKMPDFTDIRTAKDFAVWAVRNGIATSPTMAASMIGALAGPGGLAATSGGMALGDMTSARAEFAGKAFDPKRFGSADRQADALAQQQELQAQHLGANVGNTAALAVPYAALDFLGPAGTLATGGAKGLASQGVRKIVTHGAKEMGAEAVNEGGQEIVNIGSDMLARERSTDLTAEDAKRVVNAAAVGGLMGAGGHAANVGGDAVKAAANTPERQIAREIDKAAADYGKQTEAMRPTEQRKAVLAKLDDFAAEHGLSPKAVSAIKDKTATVPLAQLGAKIKQAIQALRQRDLFSGPADEQALAAIDTPAPVPHETRPTDLAPAPAAAAPADTGPIPASELLDTPAEDAPPAAIDDAAHQAATSPKNDLPEPTDAQKEAGNYKKGHVRIDGMDVSIENPAGSIRRSKADAPTPWEVTMPGHYGYIKGTTGSDGDHVDLFIGGQGGNGRYWVVNQNHADGKGHDEHKVITGVNSAEEAVDLYKRSFTDNFGDKVFGSVSAEFNADQIKAKLPAMSKAKPVLEPAAPAAPDAKAKARDDLAAGLAELGGVLGKKPGAPRRGVIGDKLASGEVVTTSSGRQTTPFPKVSVDTDRKAAATFKAVDQWLMQNAAAEAEARGDEFNARQFRANVAKPSPADKDSAEEYLFGEQPAVPRSSLKPLAPTAAGPRVIARAGRTPTDTQDLDLRANADGSLTPHLGGKPLVDFDSGEPIKLAAGVTDLDAKKAIRDAGALSKKVNFFPVKGSADTSPPAEASQGATNGDQEEGQRRQTTQEVLTTAAGAPGDSTTSPAAPDKRSARAKARRALDPESDSVLEALAKLGGIRRDVVQREYGMKPEELKHTVNVGGLKGFPFRAKGGMDLDSALTSLREAGYFAGVSDEDVAGEFERSIFDELGGSRTLTPQGQMARAAKMAQERADEERARQAGDDFDPFAPSDTISALDDFTPDDLEASGYADASDEVKALTQQLLADAESAGLDTEALREDAAKGIDDQSEDFYHARLQDLIRKALARPQADGQGGDAQAAAGGSEDRGVPAGGQGQEGADQGLTLEAQDAADLKAKTDREAAAKKADADEQKRLADKAKADAQRDEFVLTGSDRPADVAAAAGQGGLFDAEPAAAPAPAANKEEWGWYPRGGRVYDRMFKGKLQVRIEHAGHPTALRPYYFTGGELIDRVHPEIASRKFHDLETAKKWADAIADGKRPEGSDVSALFPTVEQLREDLRKLDDEILANAPKKFQVGGGDIEGALAHPNVPKGAKVVRAEIVQRIRSMGKGAPAEAQPEGLVNIPADEAAFADALASMDPGASAQADGDQQRLHALFGPQPGRVSLPRAVGNKAPAGTKVLTPEQAAAKLDEWKAEAERQSKELAGQNGDRTVISLFDASGVLAQPWADAGYNVVAYDLQTGTDIKEFSADNLLEQHGNDNVFAILAQPPCTDFASSGAQWWKKKDEDGRTEASNELVRQVLRTVELFRPSVWVMENPVGRIAKLNKLPDPTLKFDPWHFGDPYTKRTELYGRFDPDLPTAMVEPTDGSKMHRMSSSAKYDRSLTSEPFAYALFMANNADAMGPAGRLAAEFAGVDRALFDNALAAGHTEYAVKSAIEDSYYESDLETVREELDRLAEEKVEPKPAEQKRAKQQEAEAPAEPDKDAIPTKAGGMPNHAGVYVPETPGIETFERPRSNHKAPKIGFSVLELADGRWLHSIDYGYTTGNQSGGGFGLMDLEGVNLKSRSEAVAKAIEDLRRRIDIKAGDPLVSDAQLAQHKAMTKWLDEQAAKTLANATGSDGVSASGAIDRTAKKRETPKQKQAQDKAGQKPLPNEPIDDYLGALPIDRLNLLAAKLGVKPHSKQRVMTETAIEKAEPDVAKLQALMGELPLEGGSMGDPVVNGKPRAADVKAEQSLLLMPCGESKLAHRARADELYTGPMWQTLRTHRVAGATPNLIILSAEHGIVDPSLELDPYERRMTAERADQLEADSLGLARGVGSALRTAPKPIRDVQIVGGAEYRRVMRAIVANLRAKGVVAEDASIREIAGEIGEQRQQLGQYLDGFAAAKTAELPTGVQTSIRWALGRLNDAKEALSGVERARGRGHMLKLEWDDQQAKIKEGRDKLAEIRDLAKNNGATEAVEAYIREHGGEPELDRYNVTPVTAPTPPASPEKSPADTIDEPAILALGFKKSAALPNTWGKAIDETPNRRINYSLRKVGGTGGYPVKWMLTRSATFPGTGITGSPSQELGPFGTQAEAIDGFKEDRATAVATGSAAPGETREWMVGDDVLLHELGYGGAPDTWKRTTIRKITKRGDETTYWVDTPGMSNAQTPASLSDLAAPGDKPETYVTPPSAKKSDHKEQQDRARTSARARLEVLADQAKQAGAENLATRLTVLAMDVRKADAGGAKVVTPAHAQRIADKFPSLLERAKANPADKFHDVDAYGVGKRATSTKIEAGDSEEVKKAKADLMAGLGDLASLLAKPGRSNITPEEEQKLLPILTKVFDAAFRLGYLKFKEAAKFVLDQIRTALGDDAANAITLDHLQGSYIGMSGRYKDAGASTKKEVVSVEDIAEIEASDNSPEDGPDAPGPDTPVERDRGDAAPADATVEAPVRAPAGQAGSGAGRSGAGARAKGPRPPNDPGVPAGGTTSAGKRGDQPVHRDDGASGPEEFDAGAGDDQRGLDFGESGVPPETVAAGQAARAAESGLTDGQKRAAQRAAESVPVKDGIENIRETLPYLLPEQQEDVAKAEKRFNEPGGYGMLFTNGTGTGKTFTGLGTIKRFARRGKGNQLIMVPDAKIMADWVDSAKALGLTITPLRDTKDAGKGISITTYANAGENMALVHREWDLVTADEAHQLTQGKDGDETAALATLRAITRHPKHAYTRFTQMHADELAEVQRITEAIDAASKQLNIHDMPEDRSRIKESMDRLHAKLKPLQTKLAADRKAIEADVEAKQGAARTRAQFLSATPFAYENTVNWADGYLFDFDEGFQQTYGYNAPSPRDFFFMQHFGWRKKNGKLTKPDEKVDRGLMQRQFNGWLKKRGVLSGRMLEVKPDYDRKFVLVDSKVGNDIDRALDWISERAAEEREANNGLDPKDKNDGFMWLSDNINGALYGTDGHLVRRYLLEAIKAKEAVPIIKQHMALGRKVVVFHDFNKGGSKNPFSMEPYPLFEITPDTKPEDREVQETSLRQRRNFNAALDAFRKEFPDLTDGNALRGLISPIQRFTQELPGVLLINGNEKPADVLARYKQLNDDSLGPVVALVQSDKNKGWSGHDTTGKHPRVLINLGLPTQPTKTIQQEGRIYRVGQVSNAMFRYLNTGTTWERIAFAQTIARRASEAENLGAGEHARALLDAFLTGYEESDTYAPGHEGEGTGGKERDRAMNTIITAYDRAKSYYWGTQKKNSRTKAQEGADYYATPEPVGLKMVEWLDLKGGEDGLEPSAGHGAIARWLPDNVSRTAVEPSMQLRSRLALVFDGKIVDSQFEDLHVVNKYDGIAMNPPFGSGGRTAIDHLAKAATHLRDGGRIVALIPTGPAADKKFDKWFYEEDTKPVKPLLTTPVGEVFNGDTLTSKSGQVVTARGMVTSRGARGDEQWIDVKVPGEPHRMLHLHPDQVQTIKATGKRTEKFRPAEGLYLMASIKMPGVTFERAGTGVMTRIVVIEKQSDPANAPAQMGDRDLTGIDNINELFDRMEDMAMPGRPDKPEPVDPREANAAAKEEKAKAKEAGAAVAQEKGVELVEHTTGKGKLLKGVIRPDLSYAQAKEIDAYTFKKDGGWYIREEHLPTLLEKYPPAGAGDLKLSVAERAARAAADRISTNGVRSADDLRDMLRVPGYSEWARSSIAGNVDASRALRRKFADEFGVTDWHVPKLNDQGVVTFYSSWADRNPEGLARAVAIADEAGAPMAMRGGTEPGLALDKRLRAAGFVPYMGAQERAGRPVVALFSMIRPAGGITPTTPLFTAARGWGSVDGGGSRADTARYAADPDRNHLRVVDVARESIAQRKPGYLLRAVVAPGDRPDLRAAAAVGRGVAGHRVVFVRQDGDRVFNGAAFGSPGHNYLLIDVDSSRPVMAVTGHEVLHRLRSTRPDLYDKLNARISAVLRDESVYADKLHKRYEQMGMQRLSDEKIHEELLADVFGDEWSDPEFWRALAKSKPQGLRAIAEAVAKYLDDLVSKIIKLRPFGTEQYLSDLRAAREAVLEATREFQAGEVGDTIKPGDISLSIADPAPARGALRPSTGIVDTILRKAGGNLLARLTSPGYDRLLTALDGAGQAIGGEPYLYAKAGLVADYGLTPDYKAARGDMQTGIRKGTREAANVIERLQTLDRAQSRIAYLWMQEKPYTELEHDLMAALPQESRAALQDLKARMDQLGRQAVDLGLLSPETYERNSMAYLHRSYQKYELGDPGAKGMRSKSIKILGDQFKGRGLRDDAAPEKIGTPDWWKRRESDGKADTSLKGQTFHRLELRALPDTATPDMHEEAGRPRLGKLQKVVYWPTSEPIPRHLADWRNEGEWEARFFDKAGKVGMWRDFTLDERTQMGEIQEVRYSAAKTMLQAVRDIETARLLDWVARNVSEPAEDRVPDGGKVVKATESLTRAYLDTEWVQVPDAKIPGTGGLKRYGNLAGRFIPGPVWNDIRQITSLTEQGDLAKGYQKLLSMWKISKTALSPATHTNNVMSNFILADAHDIQGRHMLTAARAWLRHRDRGNLKADPVAKQLIEDYQDNGGDGGKFNEGELREDVMGDLLAQLERDVNEQDEATARLSAAQVWDLLSHREFRQAFAAIGKTKTAGMLGAPARKLIHLYGREDELFRLAAFIKARADGLSDHDAGKFARESFLDYSINAPWINALRRTAFPFIAFTYRAVPMLLRTFADKPHKLAKYALIAGALNALAYSMSGGDEDKERALLPDEKAGKIWGIFPKLLRMPWNDEHGSPVFLDVRRWIPGGDVIDMNSNHGAVPIPAPLVPGGPLVMVGEVVLNRQGFTGQAITKETDTAAEQWGKFGDYLWKSAMPNMPGLPGSYSTKSLLDAGKGKTDVFGREQNLGQAAASSLGVKLSSYPRDVLERNAALDTKGKIREIQQGLRSDARQLTRKGITEEEFKAKVEDATAKIEKLNAELRKKLGQSRGEPVTP